MNNLVPSVEKIDKIFNYLFLCENATQSEISKNLNISKATTNRLLHSLIMLNYLSFNGKEYSLGEKFKYFSSKFHDTTLLKNISLPFLEDLSLNFKETFKISVFEDNKIRVINKIESNDIQKISVPENAIFPLHAGAASKLLICQFSEKKLNSLLPNILPKYTQYTIESREELKKELFKINIKKIAFDNKEHCEAICAVAIPIFSSNNRIIAALSCPMFSSSFKDDYVSKLIISMKKASKQITDKINNFK